METAQITMCPTPSHGELTAPMCHAGSADGRGDLAAAGGDCADTDETFDLKYVQLRPSTSDAAAQD